MLRTILTSLCCALFVLCHTLSLPAQSESRRTSDEAALLAANIQSPHLITVHFSALPTALRVADFRIVPEVRIDSIRASARAIELFTAEISIKKNYQLHIDGYGAKPLRHLGILDSLYSDKVLGFSFSGDSTIFRLFAPRAARVEIENFSDYQQERGRRQSMRQDADGVWEIAIPRRLAGQYYGYRVYRPEIAAGATVPLIADPYSRAVLPRNTYLQQSKSFIFDDPFDWGSSTWQTMAWDDLIILEAHVRDLTRHPSAGGNPERRGSYAGMLDPASKGGLNYLKDLGVNSVQFLPIHEFGNIEIPYKSRETAVFNTWNPYERNHWGYMTSYFFAPETYYASGASLQRGGFTIDDPLRPVREVKEMVKALHQNGIAVILDVVYNHVAQYDLNSFKNIDPVYYFHLDGDLQFTSASGCGNDFKTDRPMVRRLIVESVLYWMREFQIDGFRFDLAAMIDWETLEAIRHAAQRLNPDVILIAEPWGGGRYEPAAFSRHGWAAWNDQFRNGVKGQNPVDGHGFIFGRWQGSNDHRSLRAYIQGTHLRHGGLFLHSSHAINYLESHDDHTLGDFIRIGGGALQESSFIGDTEANARLSPQQLRLNKLAALVLLTSQGPVMLSQGQDWARSKVIAPAPVPDAHIGMIDHNSYEKDDETNWLNFEHRELNRDLVDYYRGLISLRRHYPEFRRAAAGDIRFLPESEGFVAGYSLALKGEAGGRQFLVLLNGGEEAAASFRLPPGEWMIVVDENRAGVGAGVHFDATTRPVLEVPPTSGMVLQSRQK